MDKQFLDDFHQTLSTAEQKLLAFSNAQSETPRAAGKWTPKEIIGHLIDSASNNHQRFVRGQLQNNLSLPGYEQDHWVRVQRCKSEEWTSLVSLWKSYNLHLLHTISFIPDEALKNTHTMQNKTVTLDFIVRDYLEHMKHHLHQILSNF